VAFFVLAKKLMVGGHIVVHDQRQIGVGCGQIGSGFGHQFGQQRRSRLRRPSAAWAHLGHKSIACLERPSRARHPSTSGRTPALQLGIALMSMPE